MKSATLKIIANELGLSITTVSKALNDYKDVSVITKQRVKNLATKLNYTPNCERKNQKLLVLLYQITYTTFFRE